MQQHPASNKPSFAQWFMISDEQDTRLCPSKPLLFIVWKSFLNPRYHVGLVSIANLPLLPSLADLHMPAFRYLLLMWAKVLSRLLLIGVVAVDAPLYPQQQDPENCRTSDLPFP
jgi:hypothetical protein